MLTTSLRARARGISLALLASIGVGTLTVPLAACSSTADSVTVDTTSVQRTIAVVAYGINALATVPGLSDKIDADKKQAFLDAVSRIDTAAANIQSTTNGSVTLTLGTNWASDLIDDVQIILQIVTPIVTQYFPTVSPYLTAVSQLLPILKTFVPASAAGAPLLVVPHGGHLNVTNGATLTVGYPPVPTLATAPFRAGVASDDVNQLFRKIYLGPQG